MSSNSGSNQRTESIFDSVNVVNVFLSISCLIGISLSIYTFTLTLKLEADEDHQAVCDISPKISCTTAIKSPYGKGLGIFGEDSIFYQPNSSFGMLFYSLLLIIANVNTKTAVYVSMGMIVLSNILSLYFAHTLYFVLQTLCIVCLGIYIVNFVNLFLIYKKLTALFEYERTKSD